AQLLEDDGASQGFERRLAIGDLRRADAFDDRGQHGGRGLGMGKSPLHRWLFDAERGIGGPNYVVSRNKRSYHVMPPSIPTPFCEAVTRNSSPIRPRWRQGCCKRRRRDHTVAHGIAVGRLCL